MRDYFTDTDECIKSAYMLKRLVSFDLLGEKMTFMLLKTETSLKASYKSGTHVHNTSRPAGFTDHRFITTDLAVSAGERVPAQNRSPSAFVITAPARQYFLSEVFFSVLERITRGKKRWF